MSVMQAASEAVGPDLPMVETEATDGKSGRIISIVRLLIWWGEIPDGNGRFSGNSFPQAAGDTLVPEAL